jgi:hypothetical protein
MAPHGERQPDAEPMCLVRSVTQLIRLDIVLTHLIVVGIPATAQQWASVCQTIDRFANPVFGRDQLFKLDR